MILQNVLMPGRVSDEEELYIHYNDRTTFFDGYFNYFEIERRKKYTIIGELFLHVKCEQSCTVSVYHNDTVILNESIQSDEEKDIVLPYDTYDKGIFYFALSNDEDIQTYPLEAYYYTDKKQRDIKLAIDICTYRREEYLLKNLKKLCKYIIDSNIPDISDCVDIHIVDNAKSLANHSEISTLIQNYSDRVFVYENKNVGGSGGFTRGMIEIINHGNYTNMVIMDDDAVIEPDAVVRMIGFLSTLKDEYKDMTLGGSLLMEDAPYCLFAAGEKWVDYYIDKDVDNLDLRDISYKYNNSLLSPQNDEGLYSAWWLCCYSMNVVRKDNLPYPFFLHGDDMEFGIRNSRHSITFLNGVSVWHKRFDLTITGPGAYYDARNMSSLMIMVGDKRRYAIKRAFRSMLRPILGMRQQEFQLASTGYMDFLKGPDWLHKQDVNDIHTKVRNASIKTTAIENLHEVLTKDEYEFACQRIQEIKSKYFNDKNIVKQKIKVSVWSILLLNGFLFPCHDELAVISPFDRVLSEYKAQKVVLYEPGTDKVVLFERDRVVFWKQIKEMLSILLQMSIKWNSLKCEYLDSWDYYKLQEHWESYLKE